MSVVEAKDRLRAVASDHELLGWVRRHPTEGALSALLLGIVVGSAPRVQDALRDAVILLLKVR